MQALSQIPVDVWLAAVAAVVVTALEFQAAQPLFIGVYLLACAYVVLKAFGKDGVDE